MAWQMGFLLKEILGFENDYIEKGMDVIKKYYVSTNCNQIVLTNGNDEHLESSYWILHIQ